MPAGSPVPATRCATPGSTSPCTPRTTNDHRDGCRNRARRCCDGRYMRPGATAREPTAPTTTTTPWSRPASAPSARCTGGLSIVVGDRGSCSCPPIPDAPCGPLRERHCRQRTPRVGRPRKTERPYLPHHTVGHPIDHHVAEPVLVRAPR